VGYWFAVVISSLARYFLWKLGLALLSQLLTVLRRSQIKNIATGIKPEIFRIFEVKLVRTCYLDMADRLQEELAQTRSELQQLKERMETGAVTVHKDLSLASLIPKWSGSDSTISLEEFFLALSPQVKLQTGNKQTNYRSPF